MEFILRISVMVALVGLRGLDFYPGDFGLMLKAQETSRI